MPVLVVENDPALRLLTILLDPDVAQDRRTAFADYVAHDVPDFEGWIAAARARAPGLVPARLISVSDQEGLRAALPEADGVVVEELAIGPEELDAAPRLRFVQKFGMVLRNIDAAACAAADVPVLTQRRLTNVAVAEHVLAMLMALAKQLNRIGGRVTVPQLDEAGFPYEPYDTRHTPNANYGRVGGLRTLLGATLGLVGLGEIGREMARLGRGLGLEVLYFQRRRLGADEERQLGVTYATFDDLLARCDYVSLHVPKEVVDLVDAAAFSRMRPGAILLNSGRAEAVNKAALIEALGSGRLGGAGFDVHHKEPVPSDEPLLAFDNVLLTPHLAGGSRRNGLADASAMAVAMAEALRRPRATA